MINSFIHLMNNLTICVPNAIRENGVRLFRMYIINFNYINIMAKRIINKKGFKIIKLTPEEARTIGFGFQDETDFELICDNCGELMLLQDCYYVSCLNRALCSECFEEWYKYAERYPEDIRWETHKYNDTVRKLEVNCIILEDLEYGQ